MRSITVIHPSMGRPEIARRTVDKWLAYANMEIEYILSLDGSDAHWYLPFFQNDFVTGKVQWTSGRNTTAISAINTAAILSKGDIIVVVSDDFICPKNWCSKLLEQIGDRTDFIAKTRDGLQPTLITLPLMDRTYYKRFGYIYHPSYQHMFCDQEMTAVGHMLGRVINLDMTFEHLHYTTGKSAKDAVNRKNDSTWVQGETLFNERLKTNFGIENPVVRYSSIQWR